MEGNASLAERQKARALRGSRAKGEIKKKEGDTNEKDKNEYGYGIDEDPPCEWEGEEDCKIKYDNGVRRTFKK